MKKYLLIIGIIFCTLNLFAQQRVNISGNVTDAKTKEPLIGVSIVVTGTTNGTITDIDGNYNLNVPANAKLAFSFIGYQSQVIEVTGSTPINIALQPSVEDLDEVVVVGYGTAKKSDVTTSMVSVKGEDLQRETQGNFTSSLQGKAAGVQVITNSGAPGAKPKVLIRGFTTINSSTDPLYVVDGVPIVTSNKDGGGNGGINFLSSDEIESIEVLKDASAAAIYGTRASSGVILITTKRGKAGKTKYNFNFSYGIQSSEKPYETMNSEQYAKAMNLSYQNSGLNDLISNTENLNNTDWWEAGVRNYSPEINASINISGGSQKYQYNITMSYFKQESFYNVGKWQRFTARINNDFKLANWIKIGIDLNPRRESWTNTPDWYGDYLKIDPITPIYIPEDERTGTENEYSIYQRSYYTYVWNPVGKESRQDGNKGDNYALYMNGYVNINPIKNLTLRSQISANVINTTENKFNPEFTIDASHEFNSITNLSRKKITDFNWTWQNTATYNWKLDKHSGSVMIGTTAEEQNDDYVYAYAEGFPSTIKTMRELNAQNGTVKKVEGNTYCNSIVSYIGRVTYNYDNRYLLTATGRYDGSSKFMSNNKWAFFPSASIAWRFSQEKFLKDNPIISDAKLFAGWGNVGNQDLPSDVYLSKLGTDYYAMGDDATVRSITLMSTIKNENIKWETIEERNIGVDFSLFDFALSGSVEVYQKITHDMLFEMTYPYFSGFPNWGKIWSNIGKMEAKGMDISLNYKHHKEKFSYNIGATFSTSKMEMKKLAGANEVFGGPEWSSTSTTRMVVGDEPGYFYGYKTDGIFQNYTEINSHTNEHGDILQKSARPGDIRFVDTNHDGSLNSDDRVKIGSPYPDFTGGLNANASYKTAVGTFELGANFYFCYGNDVVNWLINDKYNAANQNNLADNAIKKAWHGEGTSNDIPILSHNDLNENFTKFSDLYVEDGSFIRLKSLQLGYSLPRQWISSIHLSDVKVTLTGQNLFTLTNFSGVDPESNFEEPLKYGFQEYSYPVQKTYLIGVNISF